ncbi:MAG TPA: hypothetical protein VMT55_00885 [Candidatus Sulfotelmatobacter sp.]|nr:hypothetical protein [Candidatus Sulfotelmatobacter sp.]
MNNLKKAAFLLSVCFLLLAFSSTVEAKTGFDLNSAGNGARPMGMGRAYTAVSDDINAIFTNPAGLGKQKNWGLTSMSTRLMDRVDYKMLGGIYPTDYGTFGLGYLAAMTPAGYATTDKASLASAVPISYGTSQLSLSYGLDLSDVIKISGTTVDLSVGAAYRATNSKFEGVDGSGTGGGLDVGLIFRPLPDLSTGLTMQNVGGGINWNNGTKEDLPSVVKLGGAYDLGRTRVALEIENGSGASLLHTGAEYRPTDNIALRLGAEQTPGGAGETVLNLTAGVGLKLAGFSFDYAYRQDGGLAENSNHYFSLSYQPDPPKFARLTVEKTEPPARTETIKKVEPAQVDGLYRSHNRRPWLETMPVVTSDPVKPVKTADTKPTPNDILSYYGVTQ